MNWRAKVGFIRHVRWWGWLLVAILVVGGVAAVKHRRHWRKPQPRNVEWADGPVYRRFSSEAGHSKNHHRDYDFYAKQAIRYLDRDAVVPEVITEFIGLDGGRFGHWGEQSHGDWFNHKWNRMDCGSAVASVFENTGSRPIPKALCLRLGDKGQLSLCVDVADRLSPKLLWSGANGTDLTGVVDKNCKPAAR